LRPDHYLNVGGQTPNTQVANIILGLEKLFSEKGKPDLLVVPGDVNSTLAGAIAANKMGVKLAHLESGLRSFDRKMPEEHNRIVTDNLSDICYVTEPSGLANLEKEKMSAQVEYVGNTMIDTLVYFEPQIDVCTILDQLGLNGEEYQLLTFHRPANVDDKESLMQLVDKIKMISGYGKAVLPLHPRTKARLEEHGLFDTINNLENVILSEPMGYFEFQKLIKHAKVVITDSGGIQEETTFRQVPCLTVRDNTERPVTITEGTNTLVGTSGPELEECLIQLKNGSYKTGQIPKFWDGNTTQRILNSLVES